MRNLSLYLGMKCLIILTAMFVLCGTALGQVSADNLPSLRNEHILTMSQLKVAPNIIVEAIKASRCNFDTTPAVLAELKQKGVPDEVLQAMVEAPHALPRTNSKVDNAAVSPTTPNNPNLMTVFGLTLERRFDIAECRKSKIGRKLDYWGPAKSVCFKRSYGKEAETSPVVNGFIDIEFPILELPLGINSSIGGIVIDGMLEALIIGTGGLDAQTAVLEKLRQKYGEPSVLESRAVQNRLGASFQTFTASWRFQNLTVTFNGLEGSLDHGLITIGTNKGIRERERQVRDLFKEKRPF
jgi:hypothetical protein